jgi:transposase
MNEALESADIDTLRRLAVEAWQRAEQLEAERAQAVAAEAQAVEAKKVIQAKYDALVTENETLLARIAELTREIAFATNRDVQLALELELRELRTRLANSNELVFGSTSERRSKKDDKAKKEPKKGKGHGPTSQPKLPVEPVVCSLKDCTCKGCGGNLSVLAEQFEESELVSSVRRSFVLKEVKRQKYACSGCGTLCAAPGPLRLIPGGRYDLAFGVQVALDKYLDAMPLERQVRKMARVGLEVTSQTLWDQLHVLYLLLLPSFLALQDRVRAEGVLHIDETRWRMMGKGSSKTWWLWVLAGATGVVFQLEPSRGSEACKALLDGFAGILVADGYSVYSSLEKAFSLDGEQLALDGHHLPQPDFTLAMCWMHARRGFIKAAKKGDPVADEALDILAELYAVEALAKERAGGDAEALLHHRRQLREERSRDLVTKLELWCAKQRVLPGTQLHQAIQFLQARWTSLKVFLSHPSVEIDNGEAERQIRNPVVGRKNYYGTRSEKGARVASLMFSLIQTCIKLGVDPFDYLVEAATRARELPGTVYLPHEHRTNSSQADAQA